MFKLNKSNRGFTLIELMIVLAVLAVLAAIVVPNVAGFVSRGKERAWDADRGMLQAAVDAHRTDIKLRTGNPWPILATPAPPTDAQPGPNPNQPSYGYIDIGTLAVGGYLKSSDAVRSAATISNTTATNSPSGSYHWYITRAGVVNSWADANAGGSYSSGEIGFQTDIYP